VANPEATSSRKHKRAVHAGLFRYLLSRAECTLSAQTRFAVLLGELATTRDRTLGRTEGVAGAAARSDLRSRRDGDGTFADERVYALLRDGDGTQFRRLVGVRAV